VVMTVAAAILVVVVQW